MMKRRFGVWEAIFVCYWILSLIKVDVNAGSCINRTPLLTGLYNLVQNNSRINASTSVQNYPPWNVRMSSNGWCSASTCVAATAAMEQYLLVNFGAEVMVEAIGTAAASNGNYVESYIVEYARSDGQYFAVSPKVGTNVNGNSACTQTEQVQQFGTPVIAQYLRIIPVEWVGSMICFKMELYGCFVRECPVVNNLSDNETLLPDANVYESTTFSFIPGTENDVREAWCAQGTDNTPGVVLTFTQPLYITYATTRGVSMYWLREYSYIIANTSGRSVYSGVDGISVYGQTNNGQYTVLFWEPITTSTVELRIDDYVPVFACVGIKLYGCVFSEVIDHSTSTSIDITTPVSITSDLCDGSVTTISAVATVSVTVTSTTTSATTVTTTSATAITRTSATTIITTSATTITTTSATTITTTLATTVTTTSATTVTITVTSSPTSATRSSITRLNPLIADTVTSVVTTANVGAVTISSTTGSIASSPTSATTSSINRLNPPITGTATSIVATSAPTVSDTSSKTSADISSATSPSTPGSIASSSSKAIPTSSTTYATTAALAVVNSPIIITVTNPATCTPTQNNDSNALAIYVPIIVIITLVLCVIIFAVVWKLRHKKMLKVINPHAVNSEKQLHQSVNSHGKKNKKFTKAILSLWKRHGRNPNVQNTPIYESLLTHESASISRDSSDHAHLNNDSRHEYVSPEYAVVNYQRVTANNANDEKNHPLAESYLTPISTKNAPAIVYNPAYDIMNHVPPLSDNPA